MASSPTRNGRAPRGRTDNAAPPQALEAERAVLAAVLLDPARLDEVRQVMRPADLYDDRHQIIYRQMASLADSGASVDMAALVECLRAAGQYEAIGGAAYLAEITLTEALTANASHHARTVAEASARRRMIRAAEALAVDARRGVPLADLRERIAALGEAGGPRARGRAEVTPMADIAPQRVAWLWPGRIPLARISMMVGTPGAGKSFLCADLAAHVSTGSPWPDGAPCERGDVLLLCAEDDPADTLRPRLDAHRADASRIHILRGESSSRHGDEPRPITLHDVAVVDAALQSVPGCRLLIIDPIGSYLGGRTDAHRDNEVRSVLAPMAALAARHCVACLIVAHRRKGLVGGADEAALGSVGFVGLSRATMHLSRDPQNRNRRLLLPGKNNMGPEQTGLTFAILGDPPSLAWEREPIKMHADDGIAAERSAQTAKPRPDADVQAAAESWLSETLESGPRPARDVIDEWTSGEAGSKRTLDRARKALGVEAYRETVPGAWWWRWPCQGCQTLKK